MMADAGAGVEIGTVNPGFVGKKKLLADSRAYTTGGAVRGRCPSVLRRRLEWTEGEHELRYASAWQDTQYLVVLEKGKVCTKACWI